MIQLTRCAEYISGNASEWKSTQCWKRPVGVDPIAPAAYAVLCIATGRRWRAATSQTLSYCGKPNGRAL